MENQQMDDVGTRTWTIPPPKTYRKKPVLVTAWRTPQAFEIRTLEGIMRAEAGDYIITGVKGEQYPCKPDIFEATYELVDAGQGDSSGTD